MTAAAERFRPGAPAGARGAAPSRCGCPCSRLHASVAGGGFGYAALANHGFVFHAADQPDVRQAADIDPGGLLRYIGEHFPAAGHRFRMASSAVSFSLLPNSDSLSPARMISSAAGEMLVEI